MEYRSILVHLDGSERASACLDLALLVARRHGAHVNALFAPEPIEHESAWSMTLDVGYRGQTREDSRRALEHQFFNGLSQAKLEGTWRTATAPALEALLALSPFADLIVMSQSDPAALDTSLANRLQARVTLAAGRPVLWVPFAGTFPTVGERIVVAWDAGQSATRALYDALPFMRLAAHTTIVTLNAEREGRIPGADIALVLARHGIGVEVTQLHTPPTVSVASALLARVEKLCGDLLVMGAYGHARWKELLLGGVTQTVLGAMPVPVLMSH
ncbi:universal stress protein [Paraburkholderia lycopersici]|uniref:Universal stress protein family protein n=1 Tax=Paraburkholderia lycopersici TaxID=416944 RepID=A0A1G6SDH4_9BURK|nr:universal stress protein [Paraburkholderia lycopersici]SDD14783.1 Universal stress protein family protein [Paraburkholderia lycopersici]